jgi:hypothetical protein
VKRRSLLKLGAGAAVLLAIAGGGLALLRPGLVNGKLSPGARQLMKSVAIAVLDGLWPADAAAREAGLQAHLDSLELSIAGFPLQVRKELSQLLTLLTSSAGRLAIAGLKSDWDQASNDELLQALQDMRVSSLAARQQIYHALRDLNNAVFFADSSHWPLIGYPGPIAL